MSDRLSTSTGQLLAYASHPRDAPWPEEMLRIAHKHTYSHEFVAMFDPDIAIMVNDVEW